MSYRTFKRILGETNFEVKCLVLFGAGLTLLGVITSTLFWWQTSALVEEQNRTTARILMAPNILQRHRLWLTNLTLNLDDKPTEDPEAPPDSDPPIVNPDKDANDQPNPPDADLQDNGDPDKKGDADDKAHPDKFRDLRKQVEAIRQGLQPEKLRDYKFELSVVTEGSVDVDSGDRPDNVGYYALQELLGGKEEHIHIDSDEGEYQYYGAVRAEKSCLECHHHIDRKEGDLIGMAKISMPLDVVEASRHGINAFVISSEFIKVVLSILAIYLVVRYVITKPVLHLKKVSDAIAHGNLDMRADIRTGDEFEELSHAFNRMLRHLVTVQEELREVNGDLDGKVDELAQVNLQLYEMNNIKNEFLATMSHELRTPLNSILGFSDVLSSASNLNDKQLRYVSNIQMSGKSLMALINDVLDLAKIESGKMELHPVEFSINDLVAQHAGTMMHMAERRNIKLTWEVEQNLPRLFQDAGKLQQVLNNLLSNAIKFTPEGGRVRLEVVRTGTERVSIIVTDNGIGIPLDEQERIFEKFRQGKSTPGQDDALTRKYEGTGLGLSIVKEISRLLGGEIQLTSEFGKGSTFTLIVPVVLDGNHTGDDEATSKLVGINRFRTVDLPRPIDSETSATTVTVRSTDDAVDVAKD
jgi:two-component system, NarL family, sensor histidine kinase BarA